MRKQLYCQVNVAAAAGNPWKHLLDHRFANVKDFKQGQLYLGRVMMLQTDGAVPDVWEGWEAPAKLVQQLVEGKVTEINFEQVYAELCRAQSRPLPSSVVASFTTLARCMNPSWQRVVVKLGGKILTTWGLILTSVREGSFEQMVDDHFEALQDTVHLRDEPRQQALYNESWGVIPTLRVGLQAVEENHRQFLHMQPDQLLVEGSTTAVTRALLPFVQDGSPYLRMRKTAAREKLRALQDLALAKHLWIQNDGMCLHPCVLSLTLCVLWRLWS